MSKCADSLSIPSPAAGGGHVQTAAAILGQVMIAGLLILLTVGCNAGPNYKRPLASVPQSYRGELAPEISPPAETATSLGEFVPSPLA